MKKIIANVNKNRKIIFGAGRKADNIEMEIKVMEWFQARQEKNLRVTRKRISEEAKKIALELNPSSTFTASDGWCTRFLARNNWSVRRRTNTSQRTPQDVIDRVTRFILL